MNINELFEKLTDENFSDRIKGEFNLDGNCIIWSYDLNKESEEIAEKEINDEDSEFEYESISSEELLQDAFDEDRDTIEQYIYELDEFSDWSFSDPEVGDIAISFKIF